MDSQRFVKPTNPNFMIKANSSTLERAQASMSKPDKRITPVDDVRYPGYASPMEDGRLVTDYKSHCEYNVVPSQYGNSFRSWLQHHADGFVQVSRHRQAERAGAYFYGAETAIPPKQFQRCDEFDCVFSLTGIKNSLGLSRDETVPSLFGTFGKPNLDAPSKRVPLTQSYEGGRNTPHGRDFTPLGLGSFNPRTSGYGATG